MTIENSKYETGLRRFGAAFIDILVFVPIAYPNYYIQTNLDNKIGLVFWLTFMTALRFFYSVFMHYKYGQTFGKMVAKVKVVNYDETRNITIRQALLRDSFDIIMETLGLFYFIIALFRAELPTTELLDNFDDFGGTVGVIWVLLELVSMQTNDERRAIHDFIAGSVVVRTDIK